MKWAIPDVLPEGVTILGGKPKIGKSWFALGLCVSTATGGTALGTKQVEQGDVLYLALEDNARRLKGRLQKILSVAPPHNLEIYLEWARLDNKGDKHLEQWLETHPNARLIVIDTLEKIRKSTRGTNVYADDYAALEKLLPLAAKYNVSIMVVHHVSKREAEDPLDELSGSTGLSGGVDSALILKRVRGSSNATLIVTGRDVDDQELALQWNEDVAGWSITGDAPHSDLSETRQKIRRALEEAGEPLGPKEVAVATGLKVDVVKVQLPKMSDDEQIEKLARGKYAVTSVTSDTLSGEGEVATEDSVDQPRLDVAGEVKKVTVVTV